KGYIKATNVNDQKPYTYPLYEASPLNRVLEEYGPGQDWHNNGKKVSTAYLTNIAGDARLNCKLYLAGGSNQSPTLSQTTNYATGQLYVTEIKDEDGNTSYEFKDKLGQIVLTRQMDGTTPLDTYYIYNDFGNQCFVLPPRIQDEGITQAKLNELAYQYKYDTRNRCIAKKIPGCEWIYYVYDKADRLIFSQDGVQYNKSPKEWTFTIPDAFGRVVLTGICKDTIPVSNKVVKGVYVSTGSYKRYNIQVDGSNKTFTNSPSILSVNFYDSYDFRGMAEIPSSGTEYNPETGYGTWYGTDYTDANKYKNKGVLTGTLTAQMNPDGTAGTTYLYSVMYYDSRGRLIQTKSNNHLTGGVEKEYIAYTFTGQPTQRKHLHQATGKNTQTEVYAYTYDHAGRLLTTTHQLTDGTTVKPQVTLAENSYDDLGRLKTNKKGGQANLNTTYAYNVRSWTKSITSPLFTETLYYNESYGGSVKQYNGNISAMSWKHNTETNPRGYAFVYDNLSRLTKAGYLINGTVQTYNATTPTNPIYQTAYSYDKHGNMKTLQRYGNIDAAKYGLIDNLTMTYAGNQMTRVDEAAAAISIAESMDFKNGSNVANEYTYNANGAMNKDLNKGITEIQYNSLNLPRQMIINSSSVKAKNYYTYSASGVKLRTEQRYDPNYTVTPSNATNPTNDGLADYKNTDYAGNIIYETVKSGSTITNKTRILVSGGYWENNVYYFYVTDHLGNNRVVVDAGGTAIQRNHYYPFGMSFADTPLAEQGKQPYKYNGKELDQMHQLNLYDNLARLYDPVIPRTTTPDPHAENYYSWSPYSWVANNPMKYIDPNGMDWFAEQPENKEKSSWERLIESKENQSLNGSHYKINNAKPPTDRLTYIGGDMLDKNNYIQRGHINDGKNDIEVSLPDYVVEAKAPKKQMHRGVALGFSTNFDFQLGKTMNITTSQVIYITDGPDKGKWIVLGGAGSGYGTPGGSFTGSLDVYDYYGHIKDFRIDNFIGNSDSRSIMAGEFIVVGATYSSSKNPYGGIIYGTSVNVGVGGLSTFIGATLVNKKMEMVKNQ
ncbi:MAG: RHS repeat-associated core domain-containing protein, partial [Dysgonomonas sp.]|uniref:RHS repeat-associated core domain-containing protein n=1 Tax=Dysgonomonas sp. TaxID=1891233 RepID=UPI003A87C0C0